MTSPSSHGLGRSNTNHKDQGEKCTLELKRALGPIATASDSLANSASHLLT